MEHKALIIGGGIVGVIAVGFIAMKMRGASAQQAAPVEDTTSFMPNAGYYYSGSVPSSPGYSSASSDNTPSNAANSGSTPTGGGFDIGSLLNSVASSAALNAASQIQSNAHTADSAILAQIAPNSGSATVSHSSTGTTVSVTQTADVYDNAIAEMYKNELGRAPDAAGAAYWKNRFMNTGMSADLFKKEVDASDEYKKAHPNG